MDFPREQTEWSRFYWYDTNQPELPRVLLVGDSIVAGYNTPVKELLAGKATVSFMSTSKIAGDPSYNRELDYALEEYPPQLVHFNNGLHGFEVSDADYAKYLEETLVRLKEKLGAVPLIFANSTPISVRDDVHTDDPVKNARVLARNAAAEAIMHKLDVPVNNLYEAIYDRRELRSPDAYHYLPEGYQFLGEVVAAKISATLGL